MVTGGIPKGELAVFTAKSNVGISKFPHPRERTSSKLAKARFAVKGGLIVFAINTVVFILNIGEWIWSLIPDKCQAKDCRGLGVRGNENKEDGVTLCDYCSYVKSQRRSDADRK